MWSGPPTIYFAGDTGFDAAMFREIARRFRIDLAVLPIAGAVVPWYRRNHMNAVEALQAFRILGAGRMLPIHFETFPASFEPAHRPREHLLAEAARLGISDQVTVLSEGERLRLPDGPDLGRPPPRNLDGDAAAATPVFSHSREVPHVE
jgi:N-acyl-phosphatidylethanolamine-hydrolysing phospholipase D